MRLNNWEADKLLDLKHDINAELERRAESMRQTLAQLQEITGPRRSKMLGRKVAPKYRGPNGETWAGRGALPVWLRELVGRSRSKIEKYRIRD